MIKLDNQDQGIVGVTMKNSFSAEELLVIRAALLNFKKAPFVPQGEKDLIDYIMKKIFVSLDSTLKK